MEKCVCLVRRKKPLFKGNALQNVREDITEKGTHTAVLWKEDRTYGF